MILLENLSQLNEARKRADKLKPRIFILEYGQYEVTGSKGDVYTVGCRVNDSGQKIVYCSCEERYPRRPNSACYHIAAALSLHIYLANGRVGYFPPDAAEHKDAIAWAYINY
jgi:hypothetical protein